MKRIAFIVTLILMLTTSAAAVPPHQDRTGSWHEDKYSMFIHFGLYSYYGGVWDGKPVTRGYSEQIQSHAGIYSDWYASAAADFDPRLFDAEEIASLAKKAGMRSIIFTSKHHDGFCMFDTQTTGYDSVEMTPSGRDYVKELSQACSAAGLNFGLYFSLIDWNYPHAYPISSHNADFITPEHHELNKAQVRELLTDYGPVSELWFDMGSLTPEQSRELYDLVKELQPDCLVSGRLGNDMYDFAVMADNRLPDSQLQAPWQSAASMFPETWSWRSWQERGEVSDKVAQKIRSLAEVVSRGGNYLLNIGPCADGSVEDFESEVLRRMGAWLDANGDAVYGTSPSPFRQSYDWGCVTVKGNEMYLVLTGRCPEDQEIVLPVKGYRLKQCQTPGVRCKSLAGSLVIAVHEDLYSNPSEPKVIRLVFDKDIKPFRSMQSVGRSEILSWYNAVPDYSYSCFDYYSNYRSTVGYNWLVSGKGKISEVEIIYTDDEVGRNICLETGGSHVNVSLDASQGFEITQAASVLSQEIAGIRGGVFDGPASWENFDWQGFHGEKPSGETFVSRPFSNYLMTTAVEMQEAGYALFDLASGNGVEVMVNGKTMLKHLNPYRSVCHKEKVLLYLPQGHSDVMLRSYNRFEKTASARLVPDPDGSVYRMTVSLPAAVPADRLMVKLSSADSESLHSDCLLHNIRLILK
mgnify:CR=1 FL=1